MKRIAIFISLIVLLFAAITPAMAADPVGTVTFARGNADITRPGAAAEPLKIGDDVYVGDIVRTKTGAKVEITFTDESIVRLAQKSRMEISEYMVKKKQQRSRLSLFRGKLQSLVKRVAGRTWGRNKSHQFLIQTPTAVCGVRGTEFFSIVSSEGDSFIFTSGIGEVLAGGDETLSQIIKAGQTGIVTDALSMPIVQPTDPGVLEPLLQETIPTEAEVAAVEEDVETVQTAVHEQIAATVKGDQTKDILVEGAGNVANPPLLNREDPGGGGITSISEEIKLRALADLTRVTLVESEPFDLTGSSFLTEASLTGELVEQDSGQLVGTLVLSGTLGDDVTAPTVVAQSELITGQDSEGEPVSQPITAIKGNLITAQDPEAGAFAGQMGGVNGTWRGLFFSIYAQRPSAEGETYNAGFVYGDPATAQDPVATGPGGEFSAAGTLSASTPDAFGTVQLSSPTAPVTLSDQLYSQFTPYAESHVPSLLNVTAAPWIKEGTRTLNSEEDGLNQLTLLNGKLLEVWLEPHSGEGSGNYSNPDGHASWVADYGQTDNSTYYILGQLSGTDDMAGSPAEGETGHVSIDGNLGYMDTYYMGDILLAHRGTYDDSLDYISITGGAVSKSPLAYGGDWDFDTVYENNDGMMSVVGYESGILGGRTSPFDNTTSELVAYGDFGFELLEKHYLWNAPIGANRIILGPEGLDHDYGSVLEGFTAGFWRHGASEAGSIAGDAVAVYRDSTGKAGLLTSGDIQGAFYPNLNQWTARGTWQQQAKASDLSLNYYITSGSLNEGAFGGRFSRGGSITGFEDEGQTRFLADFSGTPYDSLPWGIYNIKFGSSETEKYGKYLQPTSEDSSTTVAFSGRLGGTGSFDTGADGYWMADITNGNWEADGDITANVTGIYLTTHQVGGMQGPFTGLYNETLESVEYREGIWIGQSIGTFSGTPLEISGQATGELTYFTGSEFLVINASTPNIEGLIGGIDDTLFTGTPTPVILMGAHDAYDPDYEPLLMYGSGLILDGANGLISGGDAAGNFYGYMVGTWRDEAIQAGAVSLYIDGDGTAGTLQGGSAGGYAPGVDMWLVDGMLTATPRGATAVAPGNLATSLIKDHFKGSESASTVGLGGFENGGSLSAKVAVGDPIRINDQDWGVWNAAFGGSYDGTTGNTWSVNLGGQIDENYSGTFTSDGNWVATIQGNLWDDNDLLGLYEAKAITPSTLYSYTGEIIGSHWDTGESGDWQAAGIGSYIMESLTFNGTWAGTSLYSNLNGEFLYEGTDFAKVGLIDRGGSQYDLTAVGTFTYDESGGGDSFLWNSWIWGDETGTALTDQLKGFTGGHWRLSEADPDTGELDGTVALVFFKEDGTVGLMKGPAAGAFNETDNLNDSGFFLAEGSLSSEELSMAHGALDFPDSIMMTAELAGAFANGESIEAHDAINRSEFMFIYDTDAGSVLPAGVFNLRFDDPANSYGDKPAGDAPWSAVVGGTAVFDNGYTDELYWMASIDGTWADDGEINGVLGQSDDNLEAFGYYVSELQLGTLSGDVYGRNSPGTWIGQSIGTLTGDRLKLFSQFDMEIYEISPDYDAWLDGSLYDDWYSSCEPYCDDVDAPPYDAYRQIIGTMSGHFGSPDSLWASADSDNPAPVRLTVVGDFDDSGTSVWFGNIVSKDNTADTETTMDEPGSYYAFTGGTVDGGALSAKLVGIYVDPLNPGGYGGFVKGSLGGGANREIGMFYLTGDMVREQPIEDYGTLAIDPETQTTNQYIHQTMDPYGSAQINGSFGGAGSIQGHGGFLSATLINPVSPTPVTYPWGIYGSDMYGTYSGPEGNWSSMVGGWGGIGAFITSGDKEILDDFGYWFGNTASAWENGTLSADFTGQFITYTKIARPDKYPDTFMEGEILGTYHNNEWEAVHLGTYEGVPLSHASGFHGPVVYFDEAFIDTDPVVTGAWMEGILGGVDSLWDNALPGAPRIDVLGMYHSMWTSDEDSSIWMSDLASWNAVDSNLSDSTPTLTTIEPDPDDRGAYAAYMGGIENYPTLKGAIRGLYIDEDQSIGILVSDDILGTAYADGGFFVMEGTASLMEFASGTDYDRTEFVEKHVFDTAIITGGETARMSGMVGTGWLTGSFVGTMDPTYYSSFSSLSIVDDETQHTEEWGAYTSSMFGYFSELGASWSARVGGSGGIGAYYEDSGTVPMGDFGHFLGSTVNETPWANNTFESEFEGSFITYTRMGDPQLTPDAPGMSGRIMGTYDPPGDGLGTWEAVHLGVFEGAPLWFAADWMADTPIDSPPTKSVFYNNAGALGEAGFEQAILGGLYAPWYGPVSVLSIGYFIKTAPEEVVAPFMWRTELETYNVFNSSATAIEDGGAFAGVTAGLMQSTTMEGAVAAIYIDPDGWAGTLWGQMAGINDESRIVEEISGITGESMFLTRGVSVPSPVAPTTLAPADLADHMISFDPDTVPEILDIRGRDDGVVLNALLKNTAMTFDKDPSGDVYEPEPWGVGYTDMVTTDPTAPDEPFNGIYSNPNGVSSWSAGGIAANLFEDYMDGFDWGYGGYGGGIGLKLLQMDDNIPDQTLTGTSLNAFIDLNDPSVHRHGGMFFGSYDDADKMTAVGVGPYVHTELDGIALLGGDPFGEPDSLYS